ncbi:carnitine acetyl transferase [Ephemerocybe angulata]|uniref:Carnitine acetyl transferase n=1 Tax=Ephemerocybe angulata TaxID=980116 RepID=A0A8H6I655_9AGAR|nr:carnitine acetyl transferase [Tulosesus angulatus]
MSTSLSRNRPSSFATFFVSFFAKLCDPSVSHIVDDKMPGLVSNAAEAVAPETAIKPNGTTTMITPSRKPPGKTFAHQDRLPHLPVPPLEDTCKRYLRALEALQDEHDHETTKKAVQDFLEGDGPRIQQKLVEWAKDKASYIEEFWYESYLSHSDPVVLALNPFFVLENDPTPSRGTQLPRAAALIVSSLGFVHDLQAGLLEPDSMRGIPLDMDQYSRLFGTARIPTGRGCMMAGHPESRHIVVLRRGQFYWFDVLDDENRPLLTEREVLRNLTAVVADADKEDPSKAARNSIGVLTTENRKTWSSLRDILTGDRNNKACLEIVDKALFIVCLDDTAPENLADLCSNFLCGTYRLQGGEQVGTCTNRWYDKLQIIVCADGAAGINFEHTGVDGHTVLRFAADVFTEGLMLMARSINPSAPTLFHAKLSPYAKSYKPPRNAGTSGNVPKKLEYSIDTTPKKLEWKLIPELRAGVRFAETRLSDLICQNDCQALEFKGYGKNFITSHGFSPDAFVQMAFQAAYFGLYGRIECVYEPAMTKAFLHGRTEAIRSTQPESVAFTKTFYSEADPAKKVAALKKACERHVKLTKECSQGLGQDRHLYALYCLLQRELHGDLNPSPEDPAPRPAAPSKLPAIFTDPGYATLSTSIISTSNCGNPALRLFGFGPVAADGYGIGYIIKEDGISICASSKHLQTRRFLDTLQSYLLEIQRVLIQLHRAANQRPAPFVDHSGVLRDGKTGRPIHGATSESEESEEEVSMPGYSFFDSGEVEKLGRKRKSPYSDIGKVIPLVEY